ncbi:LysR family transcriptional regulator [Rhizobium johnstonii]|jgi:LysR family nitrogen assimilation transcriptional regulator|uniref:LysR family transcriptional regulator n=1 Tax=Rhizobium TaxID=379 RepID=UPI00140FF610|nr:LysR family transcriptional regulator [Rhizobium leguminosarum]QIO64048.1 LysR family transcriptional regulator [Rhizobium leguminosarum bv. trifolii]
MNVRVFGQFMKIVETGNISKAAMILGTSQPTLTKAVGELEAELGTKLLYRDGHGVRTTEHGDRFCRWAAEIDANLRQMRSDLIGESDRLQIKQVSIGVLPSVARSLAVELTQSVRKTYPNAEIRILEGVSGHLIEWLTDQRLDIAIFYKNEAARHFEPRPLITHPMCLVCSPEHELPPQVPFTDLRGLPLILASRQVGNRREFEAIASKNRLSLNVVVEADSLPSMIQLVVSGLGYTILPMFAVQREVMEGKLIASLIVEPTIDRTLVIAAQDGRARMAGLTDLTEDVKERITAAMTRKS